MNHFSVTYINAWTGWFFNKFQKFYYKLRLIFICKSSKEMKFFIIKAPSDIYIYNNLIRYEMKRSQKIQSISYRFNGLLKALNSLDEYSMQTILYWLMTLQDNSSFQYQSIVDRSNNHRI